MFSSVPVWVWVRFQRPDREYVPMLWKKIAEVKLSFRVVGVMLTVWERVKKSVKRAFRGCLGTERR